MANKACVNRLQKEYKHIVKEPVPFLSAHPSPSNILEWHFVIEGQPDSEYAGGVYHGKITFPPQYPFKPPSLQMITPNGRFATNTRLCLSMTDFHPESWNPMWSVSTILTGLMSFMYETAHTTGAISSTKEEKQRLARESLAYNLRSPVFRKLFPDWVARHEEQQRNRAAATQQQQQQQQAAQQQAQRQAQAPALPSDPAAAVAPAQQQAMERQAPQQEQQQQPGAPQQGAAAGAAGGLPWQGWAMGAASVALLALFWAATAGTSS